MEQVQAQIMDQKTYGKLPDAYAAEAYDAITMATANSAFKVESILAIFASPPAPSA